MQYGYDRLIKSFKLLYINRFKNKTLVASSLVLFTSSLLALPIDSNHWSTSQENLQESTYEELFVDLTANPIEFIDNQDIAALLPDELPSLPSYFLDKAPAFLISQPELVAQQISQWGLKGIIFSQQATKGQNQKKVALPQTFEELLALEKTSLINSKLYLKQKETLFASPTFTSNAKKVNTPPSHLFLASQEVQAWLALSEVDSSSNYDNQSASKLIDTSFTSSDATPPKNSPVFSYQNYSLKESELVLNLNPFEEDINPLADAENETATPTQDDTFVEDERQEEETFRVSQIKIQYIHPGGNLPEANDLLQSSISLTKKGKILDVPSNQADKNINLTLSSLSSHDYSFTRLALKDLTKGIVEKLNEKGFIGIHAYINPKQIDSYGKDLRDATDSSLTVLVGASVVSEIEVLKAGADIEDEDTWQRAENLDANSKALFQRIYHLSPVQLQKQTGTASVKSNFVQKSLLQDYLFVLNRYPGRRVDIKIKPEGYLEASIFYLVMEGKPWRVAYNVNNSGKKWISQFDFIHHQVTKHDDTFKASYITNDFKDFNSFDMSYERPFPNSIQNRWETHWTISDYESSLGILIQDPEPEFSGRQFSIGGQIISNFYHIRELFFDCVFDTTFKSIKANNRLITESDGGIQKGKAHFIVPQLSLRASKLLKEYSLFAQVSIERMLPTFAKDLYKLNRGTESSGAPDKAATIFRFDSNVSFYLEPLASSSHQFLANEIQFDFRLQHSPSRLIPQMKFSLGGANSVRGYPQGVLSGDSAILTSLEYRLHIPRLLSIVPLNKMNDKSSHFKWRPAYPNDFPDWDLVLCFFTDYAKAFNSRYNESLSPEFNDELWSLGSGVELMYKSYLQFKSDWAFIQKSPLSRNDLKVGSSRWHFSASLVF